MVGEDPLLREAVFSAAAALQLHPRAVDVAALAGGWRGASAVFLGADVAQAVADLGLPRRPGVYLAGGDAAELGRWSMPLGAEVIPLPEGRAWLSSVLARGSDGQAPVVTVVGGSGGVGASTLAALLACRAARRGRAVVLVDLDPYGGGLDLLMGAEQATGWRWPRLAGAAGYLGDLSGQLPQVEGVSVLSMARGFTPDVTREPLAAVVASLQRSFELVLIDPGRAALVNVRESLRLATSVLLLVGTTLRSVAAARQLADALELSDARLVVRDQPGGSVPAAAVAESIALPKGLRLPEDAALRAAAENGDPPGYRARAGCLRAADRILETATGWGR